MNYNFKLISQCDILIPKSTRKKRFDKLTLSTTKRTSSQSTLASTTTTTDGKTVSITESALSLMRHDEIPPPHVLFSPASPASDHSHSNPPDTVSFDSKDNDSFIQVLLRDGQPKMEDAHQLSDRLSQLVISQSPQKVAPTLADGVNTENMEALCVPASTLHATPRARRTIHGRTTIFSISSGESSQSHNDSDEEDDTEDEIIVLSDSSPNVSENNYEAMCERVVSPIDTNRANGSVQLSDKTARRINNFFDNIPPVEESLAEAIPRDSCEDLFANMCSTDASSIEIPATDSEQSAGESQLQPMKHSSRTASPVQIIVHIPHPSTASSSSESSAQSSPERQSASPAERNLSKNRTRRVLAERNRKSSVDPIDEPQPPLDLGDFTFFKQELRRDLESTRIQTPAERTAKKSVEASADSQQWRTKQKTTVAKTGTQRPTRPRYLAIVDSDTEGSASDDPSWRASSDSNSTPKRQTTRRAAKTSNTPSEASFSSADDKENNPAAAARVFKVPTTTFATPVNPPKTSDKAGGSTTKAKRKLYTPSYDYVTYAGDDVPPNSSRSPPVPPEDSFVRLTQPLPSWRAFNKKLDAVKELEKDMAELDVAKPSPKSALVKVRCTPPKPKIVDPDAVDRIMVTPINKYGFLKSLDACVGHSVCHPDALLFRTHFKQNKETLLRTLYDMYNDCVFDKSLNIACTWNKKLQVTAGRCFNIQKGPVRLSRIELSEKVITSANRLRCTLIHEMCHAATWLFDGESNHGRVWRAWAAKANTRFPELPKIDVCHQYEIEYKYTYKCTVCGARMQCNTKKKSLDTICCKYCHNKLEIFLNKRNKDGIIVHTPVRQATGFAKFVKDRYKDFKTADRNHADVMRALSNAFAAVKLTELK